MKLLELDTTFSRDYFTDKFGIEFGEDYFLDVKTRVMTDQKVKKALYGTFGKYGLGDKDPLPVYQMGFDDTLNIILYFGGEINVRKGVSWVKPGFIKDIDEIMELKVPRIDQDPFYELLAKKFDEGVSLYGKDAIRAPKPHGILECALEMCGTDFFEYIITEKDAADHLLDVLTETVIAFREFWNRKCYGEDRQGIELGSCSTTVMSPAQVKEMLVPRYNRIASRFKKGFLCSCGPSTHNLENFRMVKDAYYVRCGWGTDFKKASEILRGRHLKAGLDVPRASDLTPEEFSKDALGVLEDIRDMEFASLLLIHASAKTPDENIAALIETVRRWTKDNNVELVQHY
jgi:uroporphyrinogen-III decarboxylase